MVESGDVIDVLLGQHEAVKQLFAQIQDAHGDDKRKLFDDLISLLVAHEAGEQQTVHSVMRDQVTDGDPVARARIVEEQEADRELAALAALGVDDPEFDARFEAFHQAVLAHATHEEQDEFPQLRQQVPAERLHAMAGELRSIQAMK